MSRPSIAWTVIGGIAAVIGVIIGFIPIEDCGSPFIHGVGHGTSLDGYVIDNLCAGSRTGPTWGTWFLIVAGLAGGLGALIAGLNGRSGDSAKAAPAWARPDWTYHPDNEAVAEKNEPAVKARQAANVKKPAQTSDIVSRLQDLATLHDSGALTDAEYEAAKAKVIG